MVFSKLPMRSEVIMVSKEYVLDNGTKSPNYKHALLYPLSKFRQTSVCKNSVFCSPRNRNRIAISLDSLRRLQGHLDTLATLFVHVYTQLGGFSPGAGIWNIQTELKLAVQKIYKVSDYTIDTRLMCCAD